MANLLWNVETEPNKDGIRNVDIMTINKMIAGRILWKQSKNAYDSNSIL